MHAYIVYMHKHASWLHEYLDPYLSSNISYTPGVQVRGTDIEPSFLDGKTDRRIGVEPYFPYMRKWLEQFPQVGLLSI
jgi:hypothetical protein